MTEHKIYIAGPMSGYFEHNKTAFLTRERQLRNDGWPADSIFNPISSEASLLIQSGKVRNSKEAYRMCMALDCKFICEEATHMVMLKKWEHSKGAKAEWTLAMCLGLEIWYD